MMRRSRASIFCDVLIYLFLGLFAICCVYPFYYMFIYSISDTTQVMKGVSLWPAGFTLYNYQEVFKLKGIANAFGMSTARVVVGTALPYLRVPSWAIFSPSPKCRRIRRFTVC